LWPPEPEQFKRENNGLFNPLSAQVLDVLGEKLGDVFELGNIARIDGHEGLMGFKAGAGEFHRGGVAGDNFSKGRLGGNAAGNLEVIGYAQIVEQTDDAFVRIEQANIAIHVMACSLFQFQAEAGEDAQERAIHDGAAGKVQDENGVTFLQQLGDHLLEIDANRETGAPGDFQDHYLVDHRNQKGCAR